MKRRLHIASSVTEKNLAAHAGRRLRAIVTRLETCRRTLIGSGNQETAQLLSVAILQLRMKHKGIADAELKALCDAMLSDVPVTELLRPKSRQTRRRRSAGFLRLVE